MARMILRGVLFDLDGTLVDSARETTTILNGMRDERGLPPLPMSEYLALISHGADKLVRRACEIHNDQVVTKLVEIFRERYRATRTSPESLYPSVSSCLARLKNAGLRLAICTNKPDALCHQVIADTDIAQWFDVVVAGGATSNSKPHPDPIELAIRTLGLAPSDVALVGDSTVDQEASAAAGIPFVFFAAGYDDGVDQAAAVAIIDRMEQLVPLLLLHTAPRHQARTK